MNSELKIRFDKSNSKLFEKVMSMAKEFAGYSFNNDQHEIIFSSEDLMLRWNSFFKFFGLTCNWKSFKLFIDGKEIHRNKVLRTVHEIDDVKDCFGKYSIYQRKDMYCDLSPFGCVNIKSFNLNPESYGNFWYFYGHFEDNATKWVINKEEMRLNIEEEIKRKQLHFCPVFTMEKINEVIDSFPEYIDLVNNKDDWQIVYEKRFVGATIVDIPKSIRHVLRKNIETQSRQVIPEEIEEAVEIEKLINPFEPGTDEWANREIENYLKENMPFLRVNFGRKTTD